MHDSCSECAIFHLPNRTYSIKFLFGLSWVQSRQLQYQHLQKITKRIVRAIILTWQTFIKLVTQNELAHLKCKFNHHQSLPIYPFGYLTKDSGKNFNKENGIASQLVTCKIEGYIPTPGFLVLVSQNSGYFDWYHVTQVLCSYYLTKPHIYKKLIKIVHENFNAGLGWHMHSVRFNNGPQESHIYQKSWNCMYDQVLSQFES